ncbi:MULTISPECIES: heavy metal translocating P-type ATPase [unclassified Campylobacter]|uniref:heavy metal translocating P-type ATPase n=1 Tax=unclassified Campylobacter TaxID=2593542 RepID=UPI003D34FE09
MSERVKLNIAGMSCVNCSNSIQKAALKIPGVSEVNVSFANASGEFVIERPEILPALEAKIKKLGFEIAKDIDELERKRSEHIKSLRDKFAFGAVLSAAIMGFEMFGEKNFINYFMMIILAALVMFYSGKSFFAHALAALKSRNYDMNVLVALGTGSAFLYSLFVFLFPNALDSELNNMYVSSSAMIITFVLLGKFLEERSKAKAGDYIKNLLKFYPKTALVIKPDGQNVEVSVNELNVGDIVVVKNGFNVPVDGTIVQGGAEIDASMLTGESLPVYKEVGDVVFAGTLNTNGYISVKVEKKAAQTLLSQIVILLNDASAKKMPISRLADRVANIFVPSVVAIAILTFLVWFFMGAHLSYAISSAICVLIISCPCALGLATPIGIISALACGARSGILIKNPEVLELIKDVKFAVFDKTGTLSKAQISVASHTLSAPEFMQIASVEALSEHPISKAVVEFAEQNYQRVRAASGEFSNIVGQGISYKDENGLILVGNAKLLTQNNIALSDEQRAQILAATSGGSGVVLCAINDKFVGFISISDKIRDESKSVISQLKAYGVTTVMLSGDNENVVSSVGLKLGVDQTYANAMPHEKHEVISKFSKEGRVLFVGDGINDSPSLKSADVGIAMNSGSDIAKAAGDIVLIKNDLQGVLSSLKLGKNTIRTIRENLFWAFIYNIICIPVAAGVLYPMFGVLLNPVYGALAMCFSSVTVVLNSLRLRFLRL